MKTEVIEKLSALITAAFGLVAALAWNDTIKKIFDTLIAEKGTIWIMLVYAICVTIIAVIATIWIGRIAERAKKPLEIKKMIPKKFGKDKKIN